MIRAIPILVIVGLAVYTFFDVLQTPPQRIRRYTRTFWLAGSLIPVFGATLWFLVGRPKRAQAGPPRVISLRGSGRPVAPEDDPAFLRRLEDEAWRRKREEQRKAKESGEQRGEPQPDSQAQQSQAEPPPRPADDQQPPRRPNEGPATGGPGMAPAG